jgi:hypothetical protein
MANVVVSAIATWNGKALNKGKKDVSAFDKQIKQLGRTFASVFTATALFNYSKKAVRAFAEDEKAAKSLQIQLQNTGFAFASPAVEDYISNLQRTTGVLDDQLRPAFQQLLTVTGSITKSQEALNTALNVSAATGKSLTEVSAALTRGYSGNTQGLSRLGAGISKTTLKAGKMEDILAELNQKFAGQAQARLTTYAGKLDLLTVAAEDAREIIGKGIVDALSNLGKDKNIEDLTDNINKLATGIASVISGIGALAGALNTLRNAPGIKQLIDVLTFTNIFSMLGKLGGMSESKPTSNFTYSLGSSAVVDIERAKEVLRLRTVNRLRQDEINKLKAKAELDKLGEKFDTERIGLMKALNEATDAETKLRLQAKIAILDNNDALAKKLNAELEASAAARTLAESANNAANALNTLPSKYDQIFKNLYEQSIAMGNTASGAAAMAGMSARLQKMADDFAAGIGRYAVPSGGMPSSATTAAAAAAPTVINTTVNTGAVLSNEQDLERYIQDAVGNVIKLGNGVVPRGSLILLQ